MSTGAGFLPSTVVAVLNYPPKILLMNHHLIMCWTSRLQLPFPNEMGWVRRKPANNIKQWNSSTKWHDSANSSDKRTVRFPPKNIVSHLGGWIYVQMSRGSILTPRFQVTKILDSGRHRRKTRHFLPNSCLLATLVIKICFPSKNHGNPGCSFHLQLVEEILHQLI